MCKINYLLTFLLLLLFNDSYGQYVGVIPQPLHVELKPDSVLILNTYNIDPSHVETSTYSYLRNELMNKFQILSYADK